VEKTMTLRSVRRPILGVLLAISITTVMDASGLSAFSALPLFPLMVLLWYLERLPRRDVGLVRGRARHYGLALAYPVVVIGLLALVSSAAGATDVSKTNWQKAGLDIALLSLSTFFVAIVTEEGFFRGWLWASLGGAGVKRSHVLLWSSLAFALWHVSAVTLKTGFNPPAAQVPVFLVNAAVLGAILGLLRWISGSVIVASVSHGVWNGLAYSLFGFGSRVGALGVKNAALFGPEVGTLGLALNALFFGVLWRLSRAERESGDRARDGAGRGLLRDRRMPWLASGPGAHRIDSVMPAASGSAPRVTYIGGPTALLEWGGLRLLTDPTFDAAGTVYPAGTARGTIVCVVVGLAIYAAFIAGLHRWLIGVPPI